MVKDEEYGAVCFSFIRISQCHLLRHSCNLSVHLMKVVKSFDNSARLLTILQMSLMKKIEITQSFYLPLSGFRYVYCITIK